MQYYKEEFSSVLKELNSSTKGLSDSEVTHRQEQYGLNELDTKTEIYPLKIFISQFRSFIIYILLFAVAFSVLLKEYVDATIILAILIINALIGFFQELSAQRSLEALKKLNTVNAKVFRNGKMVVIDSKFLVPGDVIYLESGDKVPADCRILEVRRAKVQEASLTGESVPVEKTELKIGKDVQIGDQRNMLFSSTTVVEGSVRAVVVDTGMKTEIGKITKMIKEAKDEMTPLQKKLNDFGQKLGYVILLICFIIFTVSGVKEYLANGFSGEVLLHVMLISIALAVAAVPEGLPAVVTISLSIGVKRLLKKKALVRKLSSVETLGSCDVICTDKTGTLTKNEMTVRKAWTLDGEAEIEGAGYNPQGNVTKKLEPLLYKIGAVCNHAGLHKEKNIWEVTGDPTEGALIVSARKNGIDVGEEVIDEIPFDSDRKLMSVLVKEKNKLLVYTKGAPDQILKSCTHVMRGGRKVVLDKKLKEEILEQNKKYSSNALRVLAFAYKEVKDKKGFTEKDLVFVGLQAMIDPPRPDVIESINKTKKAGIRVIMITGDHKDTAKAIGEEVGIRGEVLTGDDLERMDDDALVSALKRDTNIFARVIPEHKQRIVVALQKLGHIVAMTGDGVNDAPALKKANIGVAVGSGTDVAKEASDFVLLDDSFSNIVNAIEEGRGIYDNIQKVILHLLSGNLAEVLIIFLAVILNFNLPLTAVLLLWINLITDGAPALALSVDPYNKDIMRRKPVNSKEGILSKKWWQFITFMGVITTGIGLFLFSLFGGNSSDPFLVDQGQTVIFTFIVLTEILLLLMIRHLYNIKMFSNIWLWVTFVFSLGMQALVIYSPLGDYFGIVPLGIWPVVALGAGVAVYYIAFEAYIRLEKLKF